MGVVILAFQQILMKFGFAESARDSTINGTKNPEKTVLFPDPWIIIVNKV